MNQYRLWDPPAGEPQGPAAPLQGQVSLLSPQEFAGWRQSCPGGKAVAASNPPPTARWKTFWAPPRGSSGPPGGRWPSASTCGRNTCCWSQWPGSCSRCWSRCIRRCRPGAAPPGSCCSCWNSCWQRPAPFPAAVGTVFRPGGVAAAPGGAAALPADHRLPQAAQRLPRLL